MSLPDLTGQTVVNVDRDYTMRIYTREGWLIVVEGDDLVDDKALAAALYAAIDKPIAEFSISEDGVLAMSVGEASIRATPDPDYESWHVTGPPPQKQLGVCTPGGELAIWS
jgi:hypothetical protein